MSQIKVVRDWRLQYGKDHMLLTALPPVGAVPMGKTIRLGPSVCLKDDFYVSLHTLHSLDQGHHFSIKDFLNRKRRSGAIHIYRI